MADIAPPQAPTVAQFTALNDAFDHFNKRLFQSKLAPCLLALSRQSRSKGYFAPRKWRN